MAARLNPQQSQRTRDAIQTTQLVKRLNSFVNDEIEMNPAQVNAAKILLGKTLPDLKAIDHTGDIELNHKGAVEMLMEKVNGTSRTK